MPGKRRQLTRGEEVRLLVKERQEREHYFSSPGECDVSKAAREEEQWIEQEKERITRRAQENAQEKEAVIISFGGDESPQPLQQWLRGQNCVLLEEDQLGSRVRGRWQYDRRKLALCQPGSREEVERVKMRVVGIELFGFLSQHPGAIPSRIEGNDWHRRVALLGTIYRGQKELLVPVMTRSSVELVPLKECLSPSSNPPIYIGHVK
ncbi:MAG: hypothetical protein A2542_01395 [Parcubacteria group bacterium RIFOXYD2_FULL_52_8]|nr:MAG: hypothetical protein A2542_01395 [Parcubacteria group bacterium RIFOXYD2_FULL_52_8]